MGPDPRSNTQLSLFESNAAKIAKDNKSGGQQQKKFKWEVKTGGSGGLGMFDAGALKTQQAVNQTNRAKGNNVRSENGAGTGGLGMFDAGALKSQQMVNQSNRTASNIVRSE